LLSPCLQQRIEGKKKRLNEKRPKIASSSFQEKKKHSKKKTIQKKKNAEKGRN
jgi:hypothetical protein